jgi:hypothetical protein
MTNLKRRINDWLDSKAKRRVFSNPQLLDNAVLEWADGKELIRMDVSNSENVSIKNSVIISADIRDCRGLTVSYNVIHGGISTNNRVERLSNDE